MQGRVFPTLNFESKYDLIIDEILKAVELGFSNYQLKYSTKNQWKDVFLNYENINNLLKFTKTHNIIISSINIDITNSDDLNCAVSELNKIQELIDAFGIQDINIAWIEKENNTHSSNLVIEELYSFVNFFSKSIKISIETSRSVKELISESKHLPNNVFFTLDVGNMTFYKEDPAFLLASIPEKVGQIHLKDRDASGQSTVFGNGCVDFNVFFKTLNNVKFSGLIVFEGFYNNSSDLKNDNYKLNKKYYNFVSNFFV